MFMPPPDVSESAAGGSNTIEHCGEEALGP